MSEKEKKLIRSVCSEENYAKLSCFKNNKVFLFLAEYIELCQPKSIFIRTDSLEDAEYIRGKAIEYKEEAALKIGGHTVHFDGLFDQARDKKMTKYLFDAEEGLDKNFHSIPRGKGLNEVKGFLKGAMKGKEVIVCFFGLGPLDSEFFIPCLQITDSFYVAHSEGILYRSAYNVFKDWEGEDFFMFVHSAGVLENNVSKNVDKRRIYIDLDKNTVFSSNTQYAGNTVGLKKLALRLAIRKASNEGWLAEHMFVMGVHGDNDRVTYFCGAYPSACGKTSTAMMKNESIIGDDIAYLRKVKDKVRAVNVESGLFGIIRDVNSESDPLICKALTMPGEVIFSNLLVSEDGIPYWLGDKREHCSRGVNFSGSWYRGKIDDLGDEIPCAHKNARYTARLNKLDNCDAGLDAPQGVEVGAIVYGGRDSDTLPPVQQSFDWIHGVITMGASLESETTAATLGKEGVRTFNLMSNLDFLSIPIAKYINNYISFAGGLKVTPLIFAVNYFLKDEQGRYSSAIEDKRIWFKWMEMRAHGDVAIIKTPTGLIPRYADLENLFKKHLDKEYPLDTYSKQFTLRIPENLSKIERIVNIYKENVYNCPEILFKVLDEQVNRLKEWSRNYGNYIDPKKLEDIQEGGKPETLNPKL